MDKIFPFGTSVAAENLTWETIAEGIEKKILRAKPGENRVLLRIAGAKAYSPLANPLKKETPLEAGFLLSKDN